MCFECLRLYSVSDYNGFNLVNCGLSSTLLKNGSCCVACNESINIQLNCANTFSTILEFNMCSLLEFIAMTFTGDMLFHIWWLITRIQILFTGVKCIVSFQKDFQQFHIRMFHKQKTNVALVKFKWYVAVF